MSAGSRRAAGSKVGRLPAELRARVNAWLAEAVPAAEIAARIQAAGRPEVAAANVESWRESGYLDHLDRMERLHEIRLRSEASVDMVQAIARRGKVPITEANDILLASLIAQALENFDVAVLKETLADNPKQFFNLAQAVMGQAAERSRREKLELEFEKFRALGEERKRKIEASLQEASKTGGITPATLKLIEEALKLL